MRRAIVLLSILGAALITSLTAPRAHALSGALELGLSGNVERFDGGTLDYGGSLQLRYMRYELKGFDHGLFFMLNYPSGFPTLFDAGVGYGLRFGKDWFLELAGGAKYSALFGAGPLVLAGVGMRLGGHWFISIPVMYRLGFSIEYMPHLGFEF